MATAQANQKVFVSPGVYTSEKDLSFVAQSVGVTTLGIVGETLRGPAFEPIFITNYDEFQTFFGGTQPVKFIGTQIPKYEAAYIAKSYLQQSNQLFVTRVLGLSGYDAGPSWSIRLIANVDGTTVGIDSGFAAPQNFTATFSGVSTGNAVTFTSALPALLSNELNVQYTLADGSTSTYSADITSFIQSISGDTNLSATTAVVYGATPTTGYTSLDATFTGLTNQFGCDSIDLDANDLTDGLNDPWYYATFNPTTGNGYSGYSWDYAVTNYFTGASGTFFGTLSGSIYTYSGTAYTDYNNLVIATFRSRGI